MRTANAIWVLCLVGEVWILWSPLAAGAEPAARARQRGAPAIVMERVSMESTSIRSIGFARANRVMDVEFVTGAVYRYFRVPEAAFDEFKRAESKGRYFAQSVRGKYEFERIEGPKK